MKYEWKKHDRELYGAKRTPTLITVPKQNYIMISGSGNPKAERVEAPARPRPRPYL